MTRAADRAYAEIRSLILSGDAAPGTQLTEEQLADICGVSRTPVRDALRRLEAELYIVRSGSQRAFVADWSREVRRLTGGAGADVVIDNVGTQTFSQSIHSCARGGRIVTVGNTSGAIVEFDNRLVFSKQISILGSTMGSMSDFKELLDFIELKSITIFSKPS